MKLDHLHHHLVIQKILLYHSLQLVIKEIQDLQDLKVEKDKKVLLELKVFKEQLELKVLQEHKVQQDHKVLKDKRVLSEDPLRVAESAVVWSVKTGRTN